MKKTIYILLLGLLTACEVIPEAERLIPIEADPDPVNIPRTHLLVEYTGFRCVNCPTAAETAHAMQQTYGDLLVVVAMHPASNPFTQGKYDYTCPEADTCYQFMGGTATTSFPTGNIDMSTADGSYFIDHTGWMAALLRSMQDTVAPYLSVEAVVDTTSRDLTITTQAYAETPTECHLALWLVEDSITGVQAMPDGSVNKEYVHRHVLRAAAPSGVWGTPVALESEMSTRTATMTIPERCDWRHCDIVALLLSNDDHHVLQTKQTQIQLQQ